VSKQEQAAATRTAAGVNWVQMSGDTGQRSTTEVVVGVAEFIGAVPGIVQVGKYVADQMGDKIGGTGGDHKAGAGDAGSE
jgi:hypothetical protein